jgi:hypothetical protein
MSESRIGIEKQLFLLKKSLEEFTTTEEKLTEKANKISLFLLNVDPALPQYELTAEQQLLVANAIAHFMLLSEDKAPFHEITEASLGKIEGISNIISMVDQRMGSENENTSFKKRARSMIWLTMNYSELSEIFLKMKLVSQYPMLDSDLISPLQRLQKFHLFAGELTKVLESLPEGSIPSVAREAMNNLLLRAKGIAAITDTLLLSSDPRTKKPLIKSCNENFINSIISKMVTGILQEVPNKNYVQLLIGIKGDIQREVKRSIDEKDHVKMLSDSANNLWVSALSTDDRLNPHIERKEEKEFKKK